MVAWTILSNMCEWSLLYDLVVCFWVGCVLPLQFSEQEVLAVTTMRLISSRIRILARILVALCPATGLLGVAT